MSGLGVTGLCVDRGGRRVLDDVSFTVPSGAWAGLVGVNGAGKTTLLKALAGRLPISEGEVRLDGEILRRPRRQAQLVGLSVGGDRLPDAPRVDRLVAEVARAHGAEAWPSTLSQLQKALALTEIAEDLVAVLSTGQRQRVGLYLAFLGAPRLVLLDEPFNGLDPMIAFDLKRALKALAESGLMILTAMHDLITVSLHCDTGLLLSNGRVAEAFGPERLQASRQDPGAFEAQVLSQWRQVERRS